MPALRAYEGFWLRARTTSRDCSIVSRGTSQYDYLTRSVLRKCRGGSLRVRSGLAMTTARGGVVGMLAWTLQTTATNCCSPLPSVLVEQEELVPQGNHGAHAWVPSSR